MNRIFTTQNKVFLITKVLIFIGLFMLAGWFLPASTFLKLFPHQGIEPFSTPLAFTLLMTISLSFLIFAFLIITGFQLYQKWRSSETAYYRNEKPQRKHTGKAVIAIFILGILLLAMALYKFYWFMIWDSTYDGLGYLWLPIPILAVLSTSILWVIMLPDKTKVATLIYLLLIPGLITISAYAQQVNIRLLTEKRGEKVSQALDAYHFQNGNYPPSLQALSPRYFILIPSPVIIYGQSWCYDGGKDYYRIGYLDREHWSSPNLIGQTFRASGELPALPVVCEPEAAAFMAQFPSPFWTFNE